MKAVQMLLQMQVLKMLQVAIAIALGAALTQVHAQGAAQPPPASRPAAKAPEPKRTIELTPAQRQAIDARAEQAVKPQSVEDALVPTPEDAKQPPSEENRTRIEQTRRSNRVTEITVTPANSARSYTMINREGRMPLGTTDLSSGLSVPQFFRFEFGRPTPPDLPQAPPPPAPAK